MNIRTSCTALLALALAACAGGGASYGVRDTGRAGYTWDERCSRCGTVERIEAERGGSQPVAGAGLVAAALQGETHDAGEREGFAVTVRTDDGRRIVLQQRALRGLREGARVRLRDGRAVLM